METQSSSYDAIIVGAGLAGLVSAMEVTNRGKKVLLLDQESEQNIGGQAWWSLGGLFLVNTPEQRRLGIKDSYDLALQDWMGTAGFDRDEDYWPRKWAEAYVKFAATEKRAYVRKAGVRFFPFVGWAERGGYDALGHGNSVPRMHVAWGTGPGIVLPFIKKAYEAVRKGMLTMRFRHQVSELIVKDNRAVGLRGEILEPTELPRGQKTSRTVIDKFIYEAPNILISSGGFGGNIDLVRKNWPTTFGKPPEKMICGVPAYVDGRMLGVAKHAGASVIHTDRMWHYPEGVKNWDPIWPGHGVRILPGPSSLWLDADGNRLPMPLIPGFDTRNTLKHILNTGYNYSWFILNQKIIKKEFALSGSHHNPDLTNKKLGKVLRRVFGKKATGPLENFKIRGEDFIVKQNLEDLIVEMNALTDNKLIYDKVKRIIEARDREVNNAFTKDMQVMAIRNSRRYIGDRFVRTAPPHKILDPKAGPLIAVKLNILTRKSLGGIETNLNGQVINKEGVPIEGLYAAGEAAGFGGGGMHGNCSLEGSFLGGCIFSGMKAGIAIGEK